MALLRVNTYICHCLYGLKKEFSHHLQPVQKLHLRMAMHRASFCYVLQMILESWQVDQIQICNQQLQCKLPPRSDSYDVTASFVGGTSCGSIWNVLRLRWARLLGIPLLAPDNVKFGMKEHSMLSENVRLTWYYVIVPDIHMLVDANLTQNSSNAWYTKLYDWTL